MTDSVKLSTINVVEESYLSRWHGGDTADDAAVKCSVVVTYGTEGGKMKTGHLISGDTATSPSTKALIEVLVV